MKKQKLNLDALNVKSFVTKDKTKGSKTIKGGGDSFFGCDPSFFTHCIGCGTIPVLYCEDPTR